MLIQKRTKWNIFCEIEKDTSKENPERFRLSFTTDDYLHFVPPNGKVTNFHVQGELSSNYSKLKAGIYYTDKSSRCLVTETTGGLSLIGISYDWQKLRELLAKLLSSTGMEPRIVHTKDASIQEIQNGWTEVIFSLMKH